jgi:hypothetical protein
MLDPLHHLWPLAIGFGEIGPFSLGGGSSMIPPIQDGCVGYRTQLTLGLPPRRLAGAHGHSSRVTCRNR